MELVTCVPDAGPDDDIEMETAGVFLLVLCVSAILVVRVVLLEVDDATVWLEPRVLCEDSDITVEETVEEELEAAESPEEEEEEDLDAWVCIPVPSTLLEVAAVVAVLLVPDDCLIEDDEVIDDPLGDTLLDPP